MMIPEETFQKCWELKEKYRKELKELEAFRDGIIARNTATLVPGTNGDMCDLGWGLHEDKK